MTIIRVRQLAMVMLLSLAPAVATAQSTLAGLVTDTTGSVLPGVTVEVASPALIEKSRTALTDGQGRYSVVDLRPGRYTLTFTLSGFATVKRDEIEVASNVSVPINVVLRVGSVEETITVTGETPVVDVQSAAKRQVLNRDVLDSLPTSRNFQQIASLLPGVRYNRPDGGGVTLNQIQVAAHGLVAKETTYLVDGMVVNTMSGDGATQIYHNDTMNQEMTFQTSAVGADTQAGGVRVNMIPREGGNSFSGVVYAGGTDGSWVSNNITPEFLAMGFRQGDSVANFYEWTVGAGGPLVRDRLWFFGSARRQVSEQIVADSFWADGRPGVNDQWIQNSSLRLTGQLDSRNKLTVLYDRMDKNQNYDNSDTPRYDWGTATRTSDWKGKLWYQSQAKWTSTVSNRLLLETGYSINRVNRTSGYQPGIGQERGTPAWYATAAHQDTILGTSWFAAPDLLRGVFPDRHAFSSAASYVTGSHAAKFGVQFGFGQETNTRDANADLVQLYRNGVPDQVRVLNTPTFSRERVNADLGLYGQDQWTFRRATVNVGVRLDHFNTSIEETNVAAGRYAPARNLARVADIPNWTDVSPRFGIVYDLFGNAKTAIKASAGKYVETWMTGFAARYNPMRLTTENRNWSDCDYLPGTSTCSGRVLATNGDDIAQDNEIGPSADSRFGIPTLARRPDPDIRRSNNFESSVGVQQQLMSGLAVNAVWFRRSLHNRERTDNLLVGLADYTPIDVVSPLSGEVITVYNLKPNKFGLVDQVDVTSDDPDLRRTTYNGYEVGVNGRLPGGGTAFGAWTAERTINVACDSVSDPNTFRFCDQTAFDIPMMHEFKVSATQPLPMGFQVSASLVSFGGGPTQGAAPVTGGAPFTGLTVNWSVSRTTRYAADCIGPCRPNELVIPGLTPSSLIVPLIAPGSKMQERWNQLDLAVRRSFRFGSKEIVGNVQVFNVTNSNSIIEQTQTFGSALGRPTRTMQPRLFRLSAQFKF